ncbi:Lrp/AsnC family transcriptional regulator [Acidomonas methanolica]|uniref:Lrp/AsnC family transcriptional regulator n=1 Tax=Acidomonas methanolica TaxID=437 RepID=UPI00211A564D|nr:Lrp/AsnC family transcriptional regulator [Acidomonas methanolica]MCQ9155831.1 Lrp/AsnC family transcriptional regulator [Acidomonas methanolica]
MTDDPLDRALLELLRRNARMPAAQLARRLGLSRTTLQGRIERLERQGAILGYTVVEPGRSDAVRALVMITLSPRRAAQVERDLRSVPGLRELHAVSGPTDLVAMLGAETPEALDRAIDAIGAVEGVERTHSAMILSTKVATRK